MNFVIEVECLHPATQAFGNFALESRRRVNDVPVLGHELCASGSSEIGENAIQTQGQQIVDKSEVQSKEENGDNHDNRGTDDFLACRPGHFLHLTAHVVVK